MGVGARENRQHERLDALAGSNVASRVRRHDPVDNLSDPQSLEHLRHDG
jgi:hypothetical protein